MTSFRFGYVKCAFDIVQKFLLSIQELSILFLLHNWHSSLKISHYSLDTLLISLRRLFFQMLKASLIEPIETLRLANRLHAKIKFTEALMGFNFLLFLFWLVYTGRFDLFFYSWRGIIKFVCVRMYFDPTFLIQHIDIDIVLLLGYLLDSSKQK